MIIKIKLTKKELEIMKILWASKTALSVTDFIERKPTLVTSTIQAALRSLLKKSYIKVESIVQHNKVYARTYIPVLSENEYMMESFNTSSLETKIFLAALIDKENNLDTLEQLEKLIQKQKVKINPKED